MADTKLKTMAFKDWIEEFKPIMEDELPQDFHPILIKGNTIETAQLQSAINENRVWTALADERQHIVIVNYLRLVNRLDVYITEKPFDINFEYQIII